MKKFITATLLCVLASACTVGDKADPPLDFDQFQARYVGNHKDANGTTRRYFDWDVPLRSDASVKALYGAYLKAKVSGESLSESQVLINLFGERVVWSPTDAKNLTYCVSDSFGSYKSAVVSAMADATGAWNTASNGAVRYVYHPELDAACNNTTALTFDVIPDPDANDGLYAFAFFPDEPRDTRQVQINVTNAFNGDFALAGILRHELGHSLGLRHETNRVEAIIQYGIQCFEDIFVEQLTSYDEYSVMTTPACMGADIKNKTLDISADDAIGVRELYH